MGLVITGGSLSNNDALAMAGPLLFYLQRKVTMMGNINSNNINDNTKNTPIKL